LISQLTMSGSLL